jgi:hypothetical protein
LIESKKLIAGDIIFFDAINFKERLMKKYAAQNHAFVGIVLANTRNNIYIAQPSSDRGLSIKRYPIERIRELLVKRPIVPIYRIHNLIFVFSGKKFGFIDMAKVILYRSFGVKMFYETYNLFTTAWIIAVAYFYASHGHIDLSKEFKKPIEKITADDINKSQLFKELLDLRKHKIILRSK